jgi:hydrogenase maturation protease
VLVAGIGNVFLGDDGFGVEVARRLAERPRPPGVEVVDFGIRGMDLAYALGSGWDGAILVDAVRCGAEPGALVVLEPALPDQAAGPLDGHAMHPVAVLASARRLGSLPERVVVVGCEPAVVPDVDAGEEMRMELSPRVEQAAAAAVARVEELVTTFVAEGRFVPGGGE